jgi:ABC-type antimicrobial peptide transport system ATPase subunit
MEDTIDLVMDAAIFKKGAPLHKRAHLTRHAGCRVTVIVGDNGAGKSLVRRVIQKVCEPDLEVMALSMAGRTTAGIVRGLVYGDEKSQSTGMASLRVIQTGIKTSESRVNRHVLVFDEPDIGASPVLAATMGRILGQWNKPATLDHIFVVTHSRDLVRALGEATTFNYLFLGEKACPVQKWLEDPVVPLTDEQVVSLGEEDRAFSKRVRMWASELAKS